MAPRGPFVVLAALVLPQVLALVKTRHRGNLRSLQQFSLNQSEGEWALPSFYHSTSGIHSELEQLAKECPIMTLVTESGSSLTGTTVDIDVVRIKKEGVVPKNKFFLLFGEHARELISPESGLNFVKTLCGKTAVDGADAVLDDSEFMVVVNGNPTSRAKVEQGDFCLRVNQNGVDLNRNWDEKWTSGSEFGGDDTNPGPKPFSEVETQIFKKVVTDYRPTAFLTVHSGTRGLYMPWAYDMDHLADRNEPQMMQILKTLDKSYCECPFGAAGKEVGYSCPGTCLDYVYDELKTPFAFAFEIYVSEDEDAELKARFREKLNEVGDAFLQQNHLGHSHFHDLFVRHPSSFVQLKETSQQREETTFDCFRRFNPDTEGKFHETLENWSRAYLDMSRMIVTELSKGNGTEPTSLVRNAPERQ